MKITRFIIYFGFTIVLSFSTYKIIILEKKQKHNCELVASIRNAVNGVFNPNEWKNQAHKVLIKRINEFDMMDYSKDLSRWIYHNAEERLIRMDLSEYRGFINNEIKLKYRNFLKDFKNENKVKYLFVEIFVNEDKVYSDYLEINPDDFYRYQEEIKYFVLKAIKDNIESIVNNQIRQNQEPLKEKLVNSLTKELNIELSENTNLKSKNDLRNLEQENDKLLSQIKNSILLIIIISLCFFLVTYFLNRKNGSYLKTFCLIDMQIIAFFYLILGVCTSMIEINASLIDINFQILGSSIQFLNQILYYQRKSIVDVAILICKHTPVVAIFLILFSIIFPLIKLFFLAMSIISEKIAHNRLISFIISNIAKWSMADVFVVALFLAYLGFAGVVNNLLNPLHNVEGLKVLLDTSNTKLHIGFYFFLSYVLFSIIGGAYYNFMTKNT